MFGRRDERPDAGTQVSAGVTASTSIPTPTDNVALMQERLAALQDQEHWASSHTSLVIAHNKTSVIFWLLCVASLCFATLNGYHGYTSSGAATAGLAAIVIGALYFTIELTVPISAHLMSWGSKGQSRWAIRIIGTLAFVLGVGFSLLILQGKFSSGASQSAVKAEVAQSMLGSDQERLKAARDNATKLKDRVAGKSPQSVIEEMKTLLSMPTNKRGETLGDASDECQGTRRTSQIREACAKYDALKSLHADAITYQKAMDDIEKFSINLSKSGRYDAVGNDAQDEMFSWMLGTSIKSIQLFKASFIAVMAALLTHLLWAAHGMTVNASIATHRDSMYEKGKLNRALSREEQMAKAREQAKLDEEARTAAAAEAARLAEEVSKSRTAEETTAEFLAARGTNTKVAQAVAAAPLREQPAAIQVQKYFTDRTIMDTGLTMQLGIFHDDYSVWCRHNTLQALPIDRFKRLVEEIGLAVSQDGRIVGAALRSR